jgi:hypothetical protein
LAEQEQLESYDSENLAGLKGKHNTKRFEEGKEVVLTLADNNILDENGGIRMNLAT